MNASSIRVPRFAPWLFSGVLACYLLTYQGVTSDNVLHYEVARHLVRTGVPALPAARFDPDIARSLVVFARKGRHGQVFLTLAPGLALLAAPFCLVGLAADQVAGLEDEPPHSFGAGLTEEQSEQRAQALLRRPSAFASGLVNPLCSALLVLVLFYFVRDLSGSPRRGAAVALIAALTTMIWPYATTFWTQPAAALGLVGALYMAWRHRGTRQPRHALAAGALAGLACAVRYDSVLVVLWIPLVFLIACDRQPAHEDHGQERTRGSGPARGRSLALFLAPLVLVAGLLAGWNFYRFGDPLDTGSFHQGIDRMLKAHGLGQHIVANLVSLNQGLLVFSPPLLLGLAGLRGLWRAHRVLCIALTGICITQLVFYSAFIFWDAAGAWGPRFLLALVPFSLLPAAFLDLGRRWQRGVLLAAVVAGFAVQLVAVALPLQAESNRATMRYFLDSDLDFFLASEIAVQAKLVLQGRIELWWLHGPGTLAAGLALAAWAAFSGWKLASMLARFRSR